MKGRDNTARVPSSHRALPVALPEMDDLGFGQTIAAAPLSPAFYEAYLPPYFGPDKLSKRYWELTRMPGCLPADVRVLESARSLIADLRLNCRTPESAERSAPATEAGGTAERSASAAKAGGSADDPELASSTPPPLTPTPTPTPTTLGAAT